MSSVTAPRLVGRRSPATRWKDLLLGPPKPRHEVLVLVDGLDQAVRHALQYAGQLNPLSVTAVHVAADPGTAGRLTKLWARLSLAVPLEVVHCPNRDLVDCAVDAVAERVRPDTEVTVLLPRPRRPGPVRAAAARPDRSGPVRGPKPPGRDECRDHPPPAAPHRPAAAVSTHPSGP